MSITVKFRVSEQLRFEDTKRIMSPEKFRDFPETGPWSCERSPFRHSGDVTEYIVALSLWAGFLRVGRVHESCWRVPEGTLADYANLDHKDYFTDLHFKRQWWKLGKPYVSRAIDVKLYRIKCMPLQMAVGFIIFLLNTNSGINFAGLKRLTLNQTTD